MTPYTPDPSQSQQQPPVTSITGDDTPTRPTAFPSELRQPETTLYHANAKAKAEELNASYPTCTSPQPTSHPSASSVVRSKLSRGLFSPRLALLAALLYNPVVLVAYLLYLYGPVNTCVVGSLCSFGAYSAPVQALLILAGSAFLWLLLYALVLRAIESPGRKTGLARLLRDLSRYERIRELLLVYGALLALLLVVSLLTRRLTLPAFIVGAFGLFVSLYCATSTPPLPESAPPATTAPVLPSPPLRRSVWHTPGGTSTAESVLPSPPQRGGVGGEEPHP